MKYAILLATAISLGALFYNNLQEPEAIPMEIRAMFQKWKIQNKKSYSTSSEENYRLRVFFQNKIHIDNVNAAQNDYTYAINKFADMTKEEFLAKYTSGPMRWPEEETETFKFSNLSTENLPAHVDWRTKGAVTPIKNQGQCGSCWAFGTTGGLEGLNVISGNPLRSFSEQQIMDCSFSFGNQGCNGGWPHWAYQYVIKNGIETEANYPYTAQDGTCHSNPSKYVFHINGYHMVPSYNNDQLKASVAQQPTTLSIDASSLQFYSGGIITSGGQQLDHSVLAIGYGVSSQGTKYWLVKNSWGTSWGMNGYFEVIRITGQGPSACGISEKPVYPTGGHK